MISFDNESDLIALAYFILGLCEHIRLEENGCERKENFDLSRYECYLKYFHKLLSQTVVIIVIPRKMKCANESVSFIKKKKKCLDWMVLFDEMHWKCLAVLVSVESALGCSLVLVLSLLKSSRKWKACVPSFL